MTPIELAVPDVPRPSISESWMITPETLSFTLMDDQFVPRILLFLIVTFDAFTSTVPFTSSPSITVPGFVIVRLPEGCKTTPFGTPVFAALGTPPEAGTWVASVVLVADGDLEGVVDGVLKLVEVAGVDVLDPPLDSVGAWETELADEVDESTPALGDEAVGNGAAVGTDGSWPASVAAVNRTATSLPVAALTPRGDAQ